VVREGSRCTLRWKAQPNSLNRLQFARRLAIAPEAAIWEDLGEYRFPDFNCAAIDDSLGSEPQRFYRISQISLAECLCIEAVE